MSASSQKSILIVDDESVVRESLGLILGRQYTVELAEHGERALELLSDSMLPDLIYSTWLCQESTELVFWNRLVLGTRKSQ